MEAVALSLESDIVASIVLKWMEALESTEWSGTFTELLEALEERVDERTQKSRSWPKASNSLSNKLKRAAPALRKAGIDVQFGTSGRGSQKRRHITIKRV